MEFILNIHYLSGAILIRETNKPDKLYYSYSDYQGSLIALTNENGNVVQRYAYDPWGARRNPANWTLPGSPPVGDLGGFNRGYTGHEHIDAFGIINMNGRVYDPLTAMFFSPDPQLQAPDYWLNYNRYGYCYGNPFRYTDPSGEFVWFIPVIVGIVSGTINLIANWHDGITFGEGLAYFGIGVGAGIGTLYAPGYSSLIAAGLGSLNSLTKQSFQPDGSLNFKNINWGQVGYSGIISGATSYLGGQFGKTLGADKWFKGIDNPLIQNVLRNVTTNAIVGGTFGGFGALADNDPNTTFLSGAWGGVKMGAVTGTISGIGNAVQYSLKNNVDLLRGETPTKTLYRAVSPEELADIQQNGIRVNPDGTGYQHEKLFYNSYEDAIQNTKAYDAAYGQKSIIIKIQGPQNLNIYNNGYMDGFKVTRINAEYLHLLKFN